jgi:hypothetical protein
MSLKDNCFEQLYSELKQIVDLGEVSLTQMGKRQLNILLSAAENHLRAERIEANSLEERMSEATHYTRLDDQYQALKVQLAKLIEEADSEDYSGTQIAKAKKLLKKLERYD